MSLSYSVECNLDWKTTSGQVHGIVGDRPIHDSISHQGVGWTLNNDLVPGLENLMDLDLSFTPATNLLQLRRVAILENEPVQLPVAWFDIETGKLKELRQTYQRRGEMQVWYEAPTVGYQGLLVLAPNGFIQHYPNFWEAEKEA